MFHLRDLFDSWTMKGSCLELSAVEDILSEVPLTPLHHWTFFATLDIKNTVTLHSVSL